MSKRNLIKRLIAGEPVERAFFRERVDMTLNAERARQAEVRLDFAQGRCDAALALVGVDEIEDLLLTGGEVFRHSVQRNTNPGKRKP